MKKRYQYWTNEGIKWTPWFEWDAKDCPKWQLKNRLKNEYTDKILPTEDNKVS